MMKRFRYKFRLSLWALSLISLFLFTSYVRAVVIHPDFADSDYKAQYYSQSLPDPIQIEAGKIKEVTVRFKNIGLKSWSPGDDNFVSVYTYNDKYRSSQFANSSWLSNSHPVKLVKITKPSEIGEFKINVMAPSKIGSYKEEFYLASENNSWVEGGYFFLQFTVVSPKSEVVVSDKLSTPNLKLKDISKELELGDSGDEVKLLQTTLKDLGHYTYSEITGYFGEATKSAVVAYQKKEGLTPYPGNVGPMTRGKLNAVLKKKSEVISSSLEGGVVSDTETQKQTNTPTLNQLANTSGSGQASPTSLTPYSAEVTLISQKQITAQAGETINVQLQLKNNGTKQWDGYQWYLLGVYNDSGRVDNVIVSHKSWLTDKKALLSNNVVESDKMASLLFNLRAPHLQSNYKIKFLLISQNHKVINSEFELALNVPSNAGDSYVPDIKIPDQDEFKLADESLIKVGLYSPNEPIKVKTSDKYSVYSGETFKGYLSANTVATLNYSASNYSYTDGGLTFNSSEPIKLKANQSNNYFEITNYSRTVSWRTNVNYNKYLGNLELKLTDKGTLYVVNELPLDDYMKGIAETDNLSNFEYIKSVLVAARGYAYYKVIRPAGVFDVYATTQDQLYLGYNSQVAMPNVVKASIDTYGEMVTYNGEVVITPYFGHSDGMTRSWSQAWGGPDKPWLKPVVAKYDQGLSMYGHGVGMSNRDASFRAVKDGWDYKQILKYYYTGVEVEQIY